MASFSNHLYTALMAEIKCSAKRRGLSLQAEFDRRCQLALSGADDEAWGDVADKVAIGISRKATDESHPDRG